MIPPLYKYVSPAGLDILVNQRIKATPPNRFNDAFEFQPLFEGKPSRAMVRHHILDKETLREQYHSDVIAGRTVESFKQYKTRIRGLRRSIAPEVADLVARQLDERRHTMVDRLSSQIGIICFTATPTSLLMWAHYASSHTGLVIGFDVRHPVFEQTKRLGPVAYSRLRPIISLGGMATPSLSQSGWDTLLTKSSEWEYESEWRTTTPLASTQHIVRNGLTEYFASMPAKAVKSVILGARASSDLQSKVLHLVTNTDYSHIVVARAKLHTREYRLEISEFEQPPL